MSDKPDWYRVVGDIDIEHSFPCDCDGFWGEKLNITKYRVNELVQAHDEYEAARMVIKERAARLGASDAGCYDWAYSGPDVENVTQKEREKEALVAWNSGAPIRA